MGKNDIYMKSYLSDKARFADLFNSIVGHGEELFVPDDMFELDGVSEIVVKDKMGREIGVHRYRDIIMETKKGETLILLAVENQEEIHYAMPVRSMLYDAMNYSEQVSAIAKENRKHKVLNGKAEFLSGFRKVDKLYPVITLVFYYGSEKWDASKDIYGLLNMEESDLKRLKSYIPNYQINLVEVSELAKNNNFKTDLQWIIGMLKYKENKQALLQFINEHEMFFRSIDENEFGAVKALLGCKNIPRTLAEEERRIDMCKALDDLYQDGVNEGIEQGVKRGEERFRRLCLLLSESGCMKELERVLWDAEYRQELYLRHQL